MINPSFRESNRMHLRRIIKYFYSVKYGVVSIINFVCTPWYFHSRYYLLHIHPSGQRPSGCVPKSIKVASIDWRLVVGVWPFVTPVHSGGRLRFVSDGHLILILIFTVQSPIRDICAQGTVNG